MKKILTIIISLFLILSKVQAKDIVLTRALQENIYYNVVTEERTYNNYFEILSINDLNVYSINPFDSIGTTYIEDMEIKELLNQEDIDYYNLLSCFGYQTNINPVVYYYMVLQEMIWEKVEGVIDIYWTDQNDSLINLDYYLDELNSKVSKARVYPFADLNITADLYDLIVIDDPNLVLQYYRVTNNTTNNIYIENNKLYIKVGSLEDFSFSISRSLTSYQKDMGYSGNGQSLVGFALKEVNTININVDVNAYKTKIKINRYADELKVNGKIYFKILNVETNEYYNYNGLQIFETNDNGEFTSNFKLDEGKYRIINVDIPNNYVYGEATDFEIKKSNQLVNEVFVINDYLETTNCTLKISSYLEEEQISGILYYIYAKENIYDIYGNILYNKNQLIDIYQNDGLEASINLELGSYYLIVYNKNNDIIDKYVYNFEFNYIDKYTKELVIELKTMFDNDFFNLIISSYQEKVDNLTNITTNIINKFYKVFANSDIYVDNVLKYAKDEYIGQYYSDIDGYINIKIDLPYGSYYIVSEDNTVQTIIFDGENVIAKELLEISNIVLVFKNKNELLINKTLEIIFNDNVYNIKTDENGKYIFDNVLAGEYTITIDNNNYIVNTEEENIINLDILYLPNTFNYLLKYKIGLIIVIIICGIIKKIKH